MLAQLWKVHLLLSDAVLPQRLPPFPAFSHTRFVDFALELLQDPTVVKLGVVF